MKKEKLLRSVYFFSPKNTRFFKHKSQIIHTSKIPCIINYEMGRGGLIMLSNMLQGKQWVVLANEEVPSMIMAITGRRGRPPNPDKETPRRVRVIKGGLARRPGRPPKPKMIDLLSKVDAKLLNRLEAKGE